MFSASASGWQFHLLIEAGEQATLVQNVAISLIFLNETPKIEA